MTQNQHHNLPDDPILMASLSDRLTNPAAPFEALVGDVTRMATVIINLGRNRQLAQLRIQQIEAQAERMKTQMASVDAPVKGTRLDELR